MMQSNGTGKGNNSEPRRTRKRGRGQMSREKSRGCRGGCSVATSLKMLKINEGF